MDVNITSIWDTFILNERLKDKRGHKMRSYKDGQVSIYVYISF